MSYFLQVGGGGGRVGVDRYGAPMDPQLIKLNCFQLKTVN